MSPTPRDVAALAKVRLLVVGDALLDRYITGVVERISPEAPVPVVAVRREFDRSGGAANVAANAASLGAKTLLLALRGMDPEGESLARCVSNAGVEGAWLPHAPRTVVKARLTAERQQVARIDWEPEPMPPEAHMRFARARAEWLDRFLPDCDAVVVSDYAKGMVDADLMATLRASRKPVVVDPRPANAPLYRHATLVTPNRREAAAMAGLAADAAPDILADALREKVDADVLVTLGGEGMLLSTPGAPPERLAAHTLEVFDVTGAGDTVAAVMGLALGAGLSASTAMRMANAAAGVVVSRLGAAQVTPAELVAALAR